MMRTKLIRLYISTVVLLATLLTGCGKTDIDPSEPAPKGSLGISVSLDELSTRAVIPGSGFANNAAIDIVLKNENSSEEAYKGTGNGIKKKFTFNGTTWVTTPNYVLSAQRGVITAFYPSDLTTSVLTSNIKTLTPSVVATSSMNMSAIEAINLNQETSVKIDPAEIDYMIGKGTPVTENSPSSTVTMRHVMAMVAVQLTKDDSYTKSGTLTKVVLANTNSSSPILVNGSVEVATEAFNEGSTSVTYTRTLTNYSHGANIAFLTYPAILYEDGLAKLTLTIDGVDYTISLRGALDGSMSLEAGKCILYKVNISGTKLSLTGVSIIPWSSGTVINQDVKPNDNPETEATLELNSAAPFTIPASGGTYTINITSNAAWRAIATNCTLDSDKGNGNGEVRFTVQADPDGMQREVRVDFQTLIVGGKNLEKSWIGMQERGTVKITVTTEEFELSGEAASYMLVFKANTAWTATCSNCTVEPANAEGEAGTLAMPFSVSEYKTGAREVSITLTSKADPFYSVTWKTIQTDMELMKFGDTYWVSKNMGGTQGATSGYGIVANYEDVGALFKWGSKHAYNRTSGNLPDGHWSGNLTWAAITPTASSTANKGYDYISLVPTEITGLAGDPCSELGQNFRTPTAAQWESLVTNYSGVFVTLNNVPGMLYGETTFITTNMSLAELPLGCMFLPAGGYRTETDGILTTGVGSYVSASANGSEHNQGLTFTNAENVNSMTAVPRGRGQSLRCVFVPRP